MFLYVINYILSLLAHVSSIDLILRKWQYTKRHNKVDYESLIINHIALISSRMGLPDGHRLYTAPCLMAHAEFGPIGHREDAPLFTFI